MRLLTPRDVDDLLRGHGMRPSRALGQHFLADPNTARRIVRASGVGPGDHVVEVGPGVGSLTLALVETGATVVAVERDRHLLPVLGQVLDGTAGAHVTHADALTVDLGQLLDASRSWFFVSNLPYNVAVPVLVRFLEEAPRVHRFTALVQREVATRLAAHPGERTVGAVSLKVAFHAEARVVGTVPPTVFRPRPKVESAILELRRHREPPVTVESASHMFELVRAGFAQRRKTLRRALRQSLGPDAARFLEQAGIDPAARAERVSLAEWARLSAVVGRGGR